MAADWVVVKVTQPAKYTDDRKTWQTVKRGMVLKNHSWLSTGNRARIVLQRNNDQVVFQPGTMAGLFERANAVVHTDFAQQSGELQLSIDPRVTPHLGVKTPFMAALVKGTVFKVKVTETGSSVAVQRGRVQVSDVKSGETVGVSAGQKASVDDNPDTPMKLGGTNKKFEQIITIKPLGAVLKGILATPDEATPEAPGKSERSDKTENKAESSESKSNDSGDNNGNAGGSGNSQSNGNTGGNGSGNGNGNGNSKASKNTSDSKDKEKEDD